eukprot:1159973-Pelagomonas_calceolata.AAC.13
MDQDTQKLMITPSLTSEYSHSDGQSNLTFTVLTATDLDTAQTRTPPPGFFQTRPTAQSLSHAPCSPRLKVNAHVTTAHCTPPFAYSLSDAPWLRSSTSMNAHLYRT